jgi:hypothetical protein
MKKLMLLFVIALGVTALNAQTRTSLKVADLPKTITDNITTAHKGCVAQEAFKVDTRGVLSYEVVVKDAKSEMTLVYDKDGKFLKSEPKKAPAAAAPAKKEPVKPKK